MAKRAADSFVERTGCFGGAERVAGLEARDGLRCLWLDSPALDRTTNHVHLFPDPRSVTLPLWLDYNGVFRYSLYGQWHPTPKTPEHSLASAERYSRETPSPPHLYNLHQDPGPLL